MLSFYFLLIIESILTFQIENFIIKLIYKSKF